MTQRVKVLWMIVVLLLVVGGAVVTSEPAGAEKCNPVCLPTDEEEAPEEPAPPPSPAPSMLVIDVGWSTGYLDTSAPLVAGELSRYVNYLGGWFNNWLASSMAPRPFRRWTVTPGGAHQISPPPIPADFNHCTFNDKQAIFKSIADSAEARARENGVNPDAYSVVVVGWSRSVCQFGGNSNGRRIGLVYPNQAMHEFGHYLGLRNHANALSCRDASGATVPLSGNCNEMEYADHYDAMGGISAYAYNAIHANQLGWLNGQLYDVVAGTTTQTFTLRPFTDPAHVQRALRLKDGPTTLWLEYRAPVGVDGPEVTGYPTYLVEPGIVVHRETSLGGVPQSQLLDMTPGSDRGFDDAPLRIGQTWANPLGEMKIKVDSVTLGAATVTVSSQKVTVPDVRGMSTAKAEAALLGAGLKPTGWGSIVDPTCAYIGVVAATSPAGGARVMPGTAVTVAVGTKDPAHPCQ
jgi:hypothetical protein